MPWHTEAERLESPPKSPDKIKKIYIKQIKHTSRVDMSSQFLFFFFHIQSIRNVHEIYIRNGAIKIFRKKVKFNNA